MKKIAIALSALAGIVFLSGCAYDGNYAYDYGYHRYAYDYRYAPVHRLYFRDGVQYDCVQDFDATFCG